VLGLRNQQCRRQTWERMTESVKKLAWLSYWWRPAKWHATLLDSAHARQCAYDRMTILWWRPLHHNLPNKFGAPAGMLAAYQMRSRMSSKVIWDWAAWIHTCTPSLRCL
jgi:hypothetical protein